MEAFCDLLSRENKYLEDTQWEKAAKLLPRKEQYILNFQQYINKAKKMNEGGKTERDTLPPKLDEIFDRFTNLMQRNEMLLKNAIGAQTTLVKLVMQGVSQDQKLGYGPNGREVKDDKSSTGLAIKNDA